jgi:hypothetical protein
VLVLRPGADDLGDQTIIALLIFRGHLQAPKENHILAYPDAQGARLPLDRVPRYIMASRIRWGRRQSQPDSQHRSHIPSQIKKARARKARAHPPPTLEPWKVAFRLAYQGTREPIRPSRMSVISRHLRYYKIRISDCSVQPHRGIVLIGSPISTVPGAPRTAGITFRATLSSAARTRTTATMFTLNAKSSMAGLLRASKHRCRRLIPLVTLAFGIHLSPRHNKLLQGDVLERA